MISNIHSADNLASTATLREFFNRPFSEARGSVVTASGDRVEISELADFLSRVAELPDVRVERIAQVRTSILDGTYETPERLEVAIDRLLEELQADPP